MRTYCFKFIIALPKKNSNNEGPIIGASTSVLIILIVICLIVFTIRRHRFLGVFLWLVSFSTSQNVKKKKENKTKHRIQMFATSSFLHKMFLLIFACIVNNNNNSDIDVVFFNSRNQKSKQETVATNVNGMCK